MFKSTKIDFRFFPESKNLGVPASEVMVHCNYFPQEFSVVITFKRELPRNENEYILSLIGRVSDNHVELKADQLKLNPLFFL